MPKRKATAEPEVEHTHGDAAAEVPEAPATSFRGIKGPVPKSVPRTGHIDLKLMKTELQV